MQLYLSREALGLTKAQAHKNLETHQQLLNKLCQLCCNVAAKAMMDICGSSDCPIKITAYRNHAIVRPTLMLSNKIQHMAHLQAR